MSDLSAKVKTCQAQLRALQGAMGVPVPPTQADLDLEFQISQLSDDIAAYHGTVSINLIAATGLPGMVGIATSLKYLC